MIDQNRLQTMLNLILYLSGSFGHSLKEIMERFDLSERTAYRYLQVIRDSGIVIELANGYYKVNKNEGAGRELSDLLHFSEEEAWILSKAIHSIDDTNLVKINLIEKLYSIYDFGRVVTAVVRKEHSENIHRLIEAIKTKKQVWLRGYKSANSSIVSDRLVEPISFTTNFVALWCYEPESNQNKLFKTARIKKVDLTDNSMLFEANHKQGMVDVFRISSYKSYPVKLRLSLRAANLLCEEYPLAEKYLSQENTCTPVFETDVCGFEGIGRFVIGLADEIEVIGSSEFINYLNNKIKNITF